MPASNSCSMFNYVQLISTECSWNSICSYNCLQLCPCERTMTIKTPNLPVWPLDQSSETPETVIRILAMASNVSQSSPSNLQLSCPLSILSSLCILSNHKSMAVHLEVLSDMSFATVTIATSILVLPALTWWPYWLLPRQLNEASPSIDFAFEPKLTEPNRLWQPKHWLRAIHACHSDCSKACAFLHNNTWHDTN